MHRVHVMKLHCQEIFTLILRIHSPKMQAGTHFIHQNRLILKTYFATLQFYFLDKAADHMMSGRTNPRIKCYLLEDKSSHEGSGGGFTVVRFFHLVVENHSPIFLRKVRAHYRLMKGDECFREDDLYTEEIAPGATVRSETFIRDSAVFDRIQWVGNISAEADQPIPEEWITFDKATARPFSLGCLIAIVLGIFALGLVYLLLYHG